MCNIALLGNGTFYSTIINQLNDLNLTRYIMNYNDMTVVSPRVYKKLTCKNLQSAFR